MLGDLTATLNTSWDCGAIEWSIQNSRQIIQHRTIEKLITSKANAIVIIYRWNNEIKIQSQKIIKSFYFHNKKVIYIYVDSESMKAIFPCLNLWSVQQENLWRARILGKIIFSRPISWIGARSKESLSLANSRKWITINIINTDVLHSIISEPNNVWPQTLVWPLYIFFY